VSVDVHRKGRSLPDPQRRNLTFVSAGLDLNGGGRAMAGRLLAGACGAFARERGIQCSLLSLRGVDGFTAAGAARGFGGSQSALAVAVWRRQLSPRFARLDRSRSTPAFIYDHLGPARAQAWLPPPLRAPYLVVLHGIEAWRPLSGSRARALRCAAVRLAPSRYTVEEARLANGDLAPVEVVPWCLEERPPAGEIDAALLESAGESFLLIVSRMSREERYKGHDRLLQALAGLQAERGPEPCLPAAAGGHPHLVIAGDGDDSPRLKALAAELGIAHQVQFTGFVSEATLAELYARSSVFVMPSRGEGFGLVYLEAMRAGKPCIAARASAAAEIVADGDTGLLVDPLDTGELAAALARLLSSPELAHRMGEAGRRRHEQLFSPARFHERLWPLLERLTLMRSRPEG
jgi:phosphatidylinositol alpha-1,6-mannosyltransferase